MRACSLDDLWVGEMTSVRVDGSDVLLVSLDEGEVLAYQGMCPHQDIPLVEGLLDDDVLVCRAHQWTFDLRDGTSINPDNCRLASYPVRVDGDDVFVDTAGVTPLHSVS